MRIRWLSSKDGKNFSISDDANKAEKHAGGKAVPVHVRDMKTFAKRMHKTGYEITDVDDRNWLQKIFGRKV